MPCHAVPCHAMRSNAMRGPVHGAPQHATAGPTTGSTRALNRAGHRQQFGQITRRHFCCCAARMLRYFGGTKLGTGGLVRAYGGAARNCLRAAPKAFVKRKVGRWHACMLRCRPCAHA